MSKVTVATLASQAVASSTRIEKANTKREASATEVSKPATGIMTDSSTKNFLIFSLKRLMEYHDGLDIFALFIRRPAISARKTLRYSTKQTTHNT